MEIKVITSNKWRNTIELKSMLDEDSSKEKVVSLSTYLKTELEKLKEKEAKGNLIEDHKYYVDNNLFDLIDHFEFVINLSEMPEEEWQDYEFDGDFETIFNDYLSELYDLADERVVNSFGVSEKFLWIN